MRASKTPACRLIDYSAPTLKFDGAAALRKQIVAYIKGVRGERQNPVTEKQIVAWFRSTPADFVKARLTETCGAEVRCCMASLSSGRRANGAYVYEIAAGAPRRRSPRPQTPPSNPPEPPCATEAGGFSTGEAFRRLGSEGHISPAREAMVERRQTWRAQ